MYVRTIAGLEQGQATTRTSKQTDKFERFRIKGGLYTAKERAFASRHPSGLMLTAPSVVGKEERQLTERAPATFMVGKEMVRFEGGKLGGYVQDYNEFCIHFEEVLRHIGRLRDLLSAGAPEAPTDLTATQRFVLRPTDDSQDSVGKKKLYSSWRDAQMSFATTDSKGYLSGGRANDVIEASRSFFKARQGFWQAHGDLYRTIAEAKRLNKPTYDLDIKLVDVSEVLIPTDPRAFLHVVDYGLEVRSKRKEYDARMKAFADIVKNTNSALRDKFEAFNNAGEVYWEKLATYRKSLDARNSARIKAREQAALFGQSLSPRSEKRDSVLAAIRMPVLVADAWRSLAVLGPPAIKKLNSVLKSRTLLERAKFHYAKPDPFRTKDITHILESYNRANSWKDVLTKDDVDEWVAMNKLWDETFDKFYR